MPITNHSQGNPYNSIGLIANTRSVKIPKSSKLINSHKKCSITNSRFSYNYLLFLCRRLDWKHNVASWPATKWARVPPLLPPNSVPVTGVTLSNWLVAERPASDRQKTFVCRIDSAGPRAGWPRGRPASRLFFGPFSFLSGLSLKACVLRPTRRRFAFTILGTR